MKIVINDCYGGFSLSDEALAEYQKRTGEELTGLGRDIPRDNPVLVSIVEQMGVDASGACAVLKVIEIPNEVNWCIEEYDGCEWVAERHRTWR